MSIKDEKHILRKQLIFKRKSVLYKEDKDFKIQQKVLDSELWKKAKQILLYMSTKDEISTKMLFEFAFKNGKEICVPFCPKNGDDMQFYSVIDETDLILGNFGIMEPIIEKCKLMNLKNNSLCVVPALAFSKSGYRLGYGKGYYDRFFAENEVNKIGLCYDEFLFENLPFDEFDKMVDIVVTDKQEFKLKGRNNERE